MIRVEAAAQVELGTCYPALSTRGAVVRCGAHAKQHDIRLTLGSARCVGTAHAAKVDGRVNREVRLIEELHDHAVAAQVRDVGRRRVRLERDVGGVAPQVESPSLETLEKSPAKRGGDLGCVALPPAGAWKKDSAAPCVRPMQVGYAGLADAASHLRMFLNTHDTDGAVGAAEAVAAE